MGFTGQVVLIGCLMLAPLVSPQTLGRAFLVTTIVAPSPPAGPKPLDPQVVPEPQHATTGPVRTGVITEPVAAHIPTVAAIIVDPPDARPVRSCPGCVIGGDPNAVATAFLASITDPVRVKPVEHRTEAAEHREVAPPAPIVKPVRITVVRPATPIYRVEPVYPQLAKVAHVQGVVELLGVLGTDGRIHELKVMRGHPLLVGAALDAVRQWIYAPTLLNGQAVEVSAPITVNFILR
jgi:protein TonB